MNKLRPGEVQRTREELTEIAILGTNRRPPTASEGSGSGESLMSMTLQELDSQGQSVEMTLLNKLTVLSMTSKSGQLPRRFQMEELSICPPEEKNCVSEKSLTLLKLILETESKGGDQRRSKLINDWLEACASRNLRVPAEFVPRLLQGAASLTEQHKLVAGACGNHFDWLLSMNRQWQKVYRPTAIGDSRETSDLLDLFEVGDAPTRQKALSRFREIDKDAARAALEATWAQESPESRSSLIKLLAINLSMADEPFLEETVLKDRRKDVRSQAAALLAQLPESRYITRMRTRAEAAFSLTTAGKLSITLPESLDDEAQRDGIVDSLALDSKLGQKATWVLQFLSYVDPQHWLKTFSLSAGAFLKAIATDKEWHSMLLPAIMEASTRYRHLGMMQAILADGDIHLTESQAGLALLKVLPRELIESRILSRLPDWSKEKRTAAPRLDLWYYLEVTNFDWSEAFTRSILNFIIKECREKVPVFGPTFTSNAGNYALRMHVGAGDLIEQIALNLERTDVFLPNAMERMTDTFKLRLEIARSFEAE